MLANAAAPSIGLFDSRPADSVARDLLNRPPVADQAKLYLPQLNIEMGLNPADITDTSDLMVRAKRFSLALTPAATRQQSPFYNLDKLKAGDEVFADVGGQRYAYQVVDPAQSAADGANSGAAGSGSKTGSLTLVGEGRTPMGGSGIVVRAVQKGVVAWDKTPGIKPLKP